MHICSPAIHVPVMSMSENRERWAPRGGIIAGMEPLDLIGLDARACYRALKSRDARFDGRLFVGITSTGI